MNIQGCEIINEQKLADYLRGNSYLSTRHRLLYVSTPMVACTSLKWWFASIEGYTQVLRAINETEESDRDLLIHEKFQQVAPHVTGLDPERLTEALTSDDYFRFAVVRNPYKRIFSAWQSKLLLREPQQVGPYIRSEFFHHPIERGADISAAFEGFLEHLASNEAPSFRDLHWTPQAALLRPDLINYSMLAKIENASELGKVLGEWLDGQAPDPFSLGRANESLIPYLPEFISERSAEVIRTLYAKDFNVFGYSKQLPSPAETFSAEQMDVAIKAIKIIRARHERLGERATQVKVLKRAMTDLDDSHKQTIARRDDEIESLRQAVARRDEQTARRKRRAEAKRAELVRLLAGLQRPAVDSRLPPSLNMLERILHGSKRRRARDYRLVASSPLFDADWYRASNPDAAGWDPVLHYLECGGPEGRRPGPNFDAMLYLNANPDVQATDQNPLIHILQYGHREGRSLVSDADLDWVDETDPAQIDAEVADIRKSGLFDEAFYLSIYRDLQPGRHDPIRHYCERGWREGRNPSGDFDTQFYLKTYSDVRNGGHNPFWHFVGWGAQESRISQSDASPRSEGDIRFANAVDTDIKLLAFYASPDWLSLRRGRPRFKGHAPALPNEELGAYDPFDWRTMKQQAQMAKRHGVHGFCFDLNIAPDATIEAQLVEQFVAHDEIEIRFCVQLAISSECSVKPVAEFLTRVFADRRQMRVDGRPVLLVKVTDDRQGASAFLAQLRHQFESQGDKAPFVIGRWTGPGDQGSELASFCDAMLDMPSDPAPGETGQYDPIGKNGVDTVPYAVIAANGVARIAHAQTSDRLVYHAVTLARDNTTQGSSAPLVYTHFDVRDYRRWLDGAIASTRTIQQDDRRFVFVNAWNDWNEGLQLEPDNITGFSRLNETTRALLNLESGRRMPMVSVIVPNYNHEPFLRRRLDSIYGQTYKNFEVILLDDCSSDQSRPALDAYAAQHAEITSVIYNDRNSGRPFGQWAKGIKKAKGELIWIAESDDYCDERFLEVLVRCFDDEAVLLAYGQSSFVGWEGAPLDSQSFEAHVTDLDCGDKWTRPYTETAHNEVMRALGIKNTIPNVSSAVFKRPVDMSLLDDESWLSMRVAGDWVFYLHLLRGGKIGYHPEAVNFFRRYQGSAAERAYKKESFYREVGLACRTVAALYDVPWKTLDRCRENCEATYFLHVPTGSSEEFARWFDYEAVVRAHDNRSPNIMITTMGFYPGGAEILPIRIANELKRQGYSVLLLSAGFHGRQDGVRRMVRNDVPVVETSDVEGVRKLIGEFGIEALNTHQWHVQKYPLWTPNVFDRLRAHVASLHGMIEYGETFEATEEQIRGADRKVTTWAYTAEKNLGPFFKYGLCDKSSGRFVKMPNGMEPPVVVPIPRAQMNIPEDAFVLCCVSRAILDKGWAETIEAVEIARKLSDRDIRLILVGNGPVYEEYCRAGTPDFVYLAGFSENSVGHYAAADMGIMLSKFKSESFPLTIVDCLFAGKPYIASDIGEIRNMLTVGDDIAGSIIELNDWEVPVEAAAQEIAAFASDHQKYMNASMLVEAAANRYRIDAVASQYIRLFEAERNNPRLGERQSAIEQHELFQSSCRFGRLI